MTAPTTTTQPERDPRLDMPCERPYELQNPATGDIVEVRCGSRLDDVCPSCAVRYHIVQRRVLDEGQPAQPDWNALASGTSQFPSSAWVTLTLPSFGRVTQGHAPNNPLVYRYADQVVAAALEPDLLRSWTEAFRRATQDWRDAGFEVSVRGSREVQERGAGHYHLLVVVNPNTPEWDGVTRAPSGAEIVGRLQGISAGTAAVPNELRAHIGSQLVLDRRTQMDLVHATRSTLQVTPRIRFGQQKDIQALNLHSDPTKDKDSFSRKASYVSKALSYTIKDVSKTTGDAGRKNRSHINRLKRESFALVGDYRATITVRRWLDKRIKATKKEFQATDKTLVEKRAELKQLLTTLEGVRQGLNSVVRWDFLDEVTPKDVLSRDPLWRFFRGREQKVWVAVQLLQQLGLEDVFSVENLRYLVKNLGVVLRRVILFHGHTGSAVYSSKWPVTAGAIRAQQKAWAIQQLIQAGKMAFGPQLPSQWTALHTPSHWSRSMASLPPA